jgi:hypothetical protein
MVLPEGRKSLGVLLAVLGAAAVVGALLAGGVLLSQVQASGYTHTVTPAEDARCDAGGGSADVRYEYADLSPKGQTVVDRAVSRPEHPVRTGVAVGDFQYGGLLDPGPPQYVLVDGDCYRLTARAVGVADPRTFVFTTVLVSVAFVGVLGLLGVLGGGLLYRAYD